MTNIFSRLVKAKREQYKQARVVQRAEKESDRLAFSMAKSEGRQLRRETIARNIKEEGGKDNRLKTRLAEFKKERERKEVRLNKKEVPSPKGVLASGQGGGVFANMQSRNIHEGVGRNIWKD